MAVDIFGPEGQAVLAVAADLMWILLFDTVEFRLRYLDIREVVVIAVWETVKCEVLDPPVNRPPAVAEAHVVGYQAKYVVVISHKVIRE